MTNHDAISAPGAPAENTSDCGIARVFLAALAARDFQRLETCFHPQSHFRALVPPGMREGTGPDETVGWLKKWFSGADHFEVVKSEIDQVADRLRMAYRIRLHQPAGWQLVEQQVYCTVKDDRIEEMDLLCSGFRPESHLAAMG